MEPIWQHQEFIDQLKAIANTWSKEGHQLIIAPEGLPLMRDLVEKVNFHLYCNAPQILGNLKNDPMRLQPRDMLYPIDAGYPWIVYPAEYVNYIGGKTDCILLSPNGHLSVEYIADIKHLLVSAGLAALTYDEYVQTFTPDRTELYPHRVSQDWLQTQTHDRYQEAVTQFCTNAPFDIEDIIQGIQINYRMFFMEWFGLTQAERNEVRIKCMRNKQVVGTAADLIKLFPSGEITQSAISRTVGVVRRAELLQKVLDYLPTVLQKRWFC